MEFKQDRFKTPEAKTLSHPYTENIESKISPQQFEEMSKIVKSEIKKDPNRAKSLHDNQIFVSFLKEKLQKTHLPKELSVEELSQAIKTITTTEEKPLQPMSPNSGSNMLKDIRVKLELRDSRGPGSVPDSFLAELGSKLVDLKKSDTQLAKAVLDVVIKKTNELEGNLVNQTLSNLLSSADNLVRNEVFQRSERGNIVMGIVLQEIKQMLENPEKTQNYTESTPNYSPQGTPRQVILGVQPTPSLVSPFKETSINLDPHSEIVDHNQHISELEKEISEKEKEIEQNKGEIEQKREKVQEFMKDQSPDVKAIMEENIRLKQAFSSYQRTSEKLHQQELESTQRRNQDLSKECEILNKLLEDLRRENKTLNEKYSEHLENLVQNYDEKLKFIYKLENNVKEREQTCLEKDRQLRNKEKQLEEEKHHLEQERTRKLNEATMQQSKTTDWSLPIMLFVALVLVVQIFYPLQIN